MSLWWCCRDIKNKHRKQTNYLISICFTLREVIYFFLQYSKYNYSTNFAVVLWGKIIHVLDDTSSMDRQMYYTLLLITDKSSLRLSES